MYCKANKNLERDKMENVKIDICFPNYLTDEVKRCITSTLESLGVIDMKMSEIDSELLDIVIPEEKLETVKIFLNLLAIADLGGAYTHGLTE